MDTKLVDWWSVPHFIIGYLFGRFGPLDVYQFTAVNAGWEIFENTILKKHIFNAPFGKASVLESKGNAFCDFLITEGGYGLGMYQRLAERPMMDFVAKTANQPLLGAEVGVYMGGNAISILKKLPIKKLYLVDPYIEYTGFNIQYPSDHPYLPPFVSQARGIAHNRLRPYGDKVQFVEETGHFGAQYLPDGLDFVYIDGNHSYDYVMDDIKTYYAKIKIGGIIGGHDYNYPGVKDAVDDFALKYNKQVFSGNIDWWLIK